MVEVTSWDWVIASFAISLVVLQMVRGSRRVCQLVRSRSLCSSLRSLRSFLEENGGEEEIDEKSRKLVELELIEMRKRLFLGAASVSLTICCYSWVTIAYQVFFMRDVTRWMTPYQDVGLMAYSIATAIMVSIPRLLTEKSLVLWYSIFMPCFVLATLSNGSSSDTLWTSFLVSLFRLAYTVSLGKMRHTIFWNSLCFISTVYSFFSMRIVHLELMIFSLALLGTTFIRRAMEAYTRSLIQLRTLSGESSAMNELLRLVCDVTVKLDSDLAFVEADSAFAAFLTLAPGRDVTGVPFKQFMPDATEHSSFEESLARSLPNSTGNTSQPGALHVSLRDGWGNNVPTEVFFVAFESGHDFSQHYLVGLRESSELQIRELPNFSRAGGSNAAGRQPVPVRTQQAAAEPNGTPALAERSSLDDDDRSSLGSMTSSRRSSSIGQDPRLAVPTGKPTEQLAMQVSLAMTMKRWNIRYSHRAGDCCAFHRQLAVLQATAKHMRQLQCHSSFEIVNTAQCDCCCIMGAGPGETCEVCRKGSLVTVPKPGRTMSL